MNSIEFHLEGNKAFLTRNKQKKEISRDLLLEICQLLLSNLTEARDYSSVTSINKLLRIIDLECEPDDSGAEEESDNEESDGEPEPAPKKPAQNKKPAPARGRPGPRTVKRTPVKKEESDDEEESDEEDSE